MAATFGTATRRLTGAPLASAVAGPNVAGMRAAAMSDTKNTSGVRTRRLVAPFRVEGIDLAKPLGMLVFFAPWGPASGRASAGKVCPGTDVR